VYDKSISKKIRIIQSRKFNMFACVLGIPLKMAILLSRTSGRG
jgi:hypothetical protein